MSMRHNGVRTVVIIETLIAFLLLAFFTSEDFRSEVARSVGGLHVPLPLAFSFLAIVYFVINFPITLPLTLVEPSLSSSLGILGWHVMVFQICLVWVLSILFWGTVLKLVLKARREPT